MAKIISWIPTPDDSGNFKQESGWNVILKQIFTVLMTPIGSRQWQPEFGSKLQEFLFEHSDNAVEIENEIKRCFKWLPHVSLIQVDISIYPITNRSGTAARVNLVVEWNNERLPVGISIPSNLDKLTGTIYDVGVTS